MITNMTCAPLVPMAAQQGTPDQPWEGGEGFLVEVRSALS